MRKLPHLPFLLLSFLLLSVGGPAQALEETPQLFEVLSGSLTTVSDAVELRVDRELLESNPSRLALTLPDGRELVFSRDAFERQGEADFSWSGDLVGQSAFGSVSFYYLNGRLLGEVFPGDGTGYRLVPDGDLHRLEAQAEPLGSACDVGEPVASELGAVSLPLQAVAAGMTGTTDADCVEPASFTGIDLLVLYPVSLAGSQMAVIDYANTRTNQANTIFWRSGAKVQYNLVRVAPLTGEQPPEPPPLQPGQDPETVPAPTKLALDWLNAQFATAAVDTEAEILRRAYGADMVAIVLPGHPNRNCGRANLPELHNGTEVLGDDPNNTPFGNKAFSAMELNCGNGDLTFAHELGHNWGLRHDTPRTPRNLFPWSYGYIFPNPDVGDRSTMMGCVDPITPVCRRVKRVSTPDRKVNQVPIGLHSSQSTTPAHNACVVNLRINPYKNFAQPRPSSPPELAITSPANLAQVQPGALFSLVASATDPEDGDLRSGVSWSSDLQGPLGSGSPRTASLSQVGRHLITASVTDSSGTKMVHSIRLDVVEADPPRRWIDRPSHNELVSGEFLVHGWATDASGVVGVSFKLDGAPITLEGFQYGTHRADVCNVHGDLNDPNCPFVGFSATLDTQDLPNGTHVLQGTFTDFFGNAGTFNRTFRTQNVSTIFPALVADAWVNEASPTQNNGGDTTLHLRGSGSDLARHSYLKFQVTGATRPVISAKLQLWTQTTPLGGLQVYWIQTTSWSESTINWNNAPLDPLLNFSTSSHPANTRIEIDVSSIISGNGTYTIGLVSPDTPGQAIFSREAGIFAPCLEVTF